MLGGDTFIPARFNCHLWIVLSDPSVDPENVVIVNLTTHTIDEEQHCVINKGEHPFVKHKTAVRYSDGKIVTVEVLEELIAKNQLTSHKPLSPALLKK